MREKRAIYINGYAGIVGLVVLALVGLFFFYLGMWQAKVWALFLSIFLWLIALLLLSSATVVSPNQAKVILFFGQYLGTIREKWLFPYDSFGTKNDCFVESSEFQQFCFKSQ